MSRIFDHKKQYVCTEVFRLEDLQNQAAALEIIALDDEIDFPLYRDLMDVRQAINEFIKNLEEQEKALEYLKPDSRVNCNTFLEGMRTLKYLWVNRERRK
ncbi:MAG: hypothetical protein LLG40_15615 [Deltaproteobacteria bacterium]|nr:hypothetical protein [Deltaproteobacteria bacterium]